MDMNIPADYKPTEADKTQAENRQELARLLAKTHLPMVLSRLVENSIDPSATHKQLIDTADYLYRVSGLSAKQEKQEANTGFSIQIVLPGQNKEITIGGAPVEKTEEDKVLDVVPTYVSDLVLNLEDMDFSED